VWLAVALTTRMSSMGALAAFLVSPLVAYALLPAWWFVAPAFIAALVLWRHQDNIGRLMNGTEPRMGAQPGA
jgi:glycerol-3-phosphate acyltransferase PlsY